MISIIPATGNNFVLERTPEKTTISYPIVGWQHLQGHWALPVTVVNIKGGLTVGKAVLHASGYVSDPSTGLVFFNKAEWEAAVDRPGYTNAADTPVEDTQEPAAPAAPAAAPAPAKTIPDKPAGKPQVFKTTSFWREIGDTPEESFSIFTVGPGASAPAKNDGRYEKITRGGWQKLRADGVPVNPWPMVDPEEPESMDDIEDETEPDEAIEDDQFDDLI